MTAWGKMARERKSFDEIAAWLKKDINSIVDNAYNNYKPNPSKDTAFTFDKDNVMLKIAQCFQQALWDCGMPTKVTITNGVLDVSTPDAEDLVSIANELQVAPGISADETYIKEMKENLQTWSQDRSFITLHEEKIGNQNFNAKLQGALNDLNKTLTESMEQTADRKEMHTAKLQANGFKSSIFSNILKAVAVIIAAVAIAAIVAAAISLKAEEVKDILPADFSLPVDKLHELLSDKEIPVLLGGILGVVTSLGLNHAVNVHNHQAEAKVIQKEMREDTIGNVLDKCTEVFEAPLALLEAAHGMIKAPTI